LPPDHVLMDPSTLFRAGSPAIQYRKSNNLGMRCREPPELDDERLHDLQPNVAVLAAEWGYFLLLIGNMLDHKN